MIGPAVAPVCTPVFVAPPLLDVQVAVNFVIVEPLFAPATYETTIGPTVVEVVAAGRAATPVGFAGAAGVMLRATL